MNNSALLRNVLWTTCLSIALILLGISSKSANAQSSPVLFPTANPINFPSPAILFLLATSMAMESSTLPM